jgi:hypothetical protein
MNAPAPSGTGVATRMPQRQVALVDLLDRVLAGGVVIAGDVTLSIADVDLVRVSLRALVVSIRAGMSSADGPNNPGNPGSRVDPAGPGSHDGPGAGDSGPPPC